MTCKHSPGDPNCGKSKGYYSPSYGASETPDNSKYEIVEVEQIGKHLVMKILYPNCSKCSFEGNKVIVFLNTNSIDALKWKKIDPHFRDSTKPALVKEAPAPAARFPATKDGWTDAITYARGKS